MLNEDSDTYVRAGDPRAVSSLSHLAGAKVCTLLHTLPTTSTPQAEPYARACLPVTASRPRPTLCSSTARRPHCPAQLPLPLPLHPHPHPSPTHPPPAPPTPPTPPNPYPRHPHTPIHPPPPSRQVRKPHDDALANMGQFGRDVQLATTSPARGGGGWSPPSSRRAPRLTSVSRSTTCCTSARSRRPPASSAPPCPPTGRSSAPSWPSTGRRRRSASAAARPRAAPRTRPSSAWWRPATRRTPATAALPAQARVPPRAHRAREEVPRPGGAQAAGRRQGAVVLLHGGGVQQGLRQLRRALPAQALAPPGAHPEERGGGEGVEAQQEGQGAAGHPTLHPNPNPNPNPHPHPRPNPNPNP